jgi:hypothetical protein
LHESRTPLGYIGVRSDPARWTKTVDFEVSGNSKECGAAGLTDLGGLLLNQLLTGGLNRNTEEPIVILHDK